MKFAVHQLSRQGGREKNEDRMGYSYTREAVLLALADGMGGHPKGEVAAQLAIQTVSELFQRQAQPALGNVAGFLSEALMAAHQAIVNHGNTHAMLDNPRTTLVVAVFRTLAWWGGYAWPAALGASVALGARLELRLVRHRGRVGVGRRFRLVAAERVGAGECQPTGACRQGCKAGRRPSPWPR